MQQRVEQRHRICTYDRAGYASSDMGPAPRTFAQLNLELHELLRRAGEKPPYVLVGQSFGGAVVRNYAASYPDEVAGMVLAESVAEHQPLVFGGKAVLLKDSATGKPISQPNLSGEIPVIQGTAKNAPEEPLPDVYFALPVWLQQLHRQFSTKPELDAAESSQRDWSAEYFAAWDRVPQTGLLGAKPLIVMTRAASGYEAGANYSLEQVDGQRLRAQTELLTLSSNSVQIILRKGHNLHLEAPDAVAWAIDAVATAASRHAPLLGVAPVPSAPATGGK